MRALVKTGFGARVTPYVKGSAVVNVNDLDKDMSLDFIRWMRERNLSSEDHVMRLEEGYFLFPLYNVVFYSNPFLLVYFCITESL